MVIFNNFLFKIQFELHEIIMQKVNIPFYKKNYINLWIGGNV